MDGSGKLCYMFIFNIFVLGTKEKQNSARKHVEVRRRDETNGFFVVPDDTKTSGRQA